MKPSARVLPVVLALVLAPLAMGCSRKADRSTAPAVAGLAAAPAPQAAPAQASAGDGKPAARHALLEIHAQLELELEDGKRAQALAGKLEDFARSNGGYVGESHDDGGALHMVLRIPASQLRAARAQLAGEGRVLRQSEQAIDVTDAIADLDARLRSARIEETRILKLLEEKSGSITDVLAAERALADVRQRVERLEADQRVAQGRVDLATLEITLHRTAAVAPDPSVAERLSDAAKDGVTGVKVVSMGLATTALRAGPTLVLFAAFGAAILLAVRRLRKVARNG